MLRQHALHAARLDFFVEPEAEIAVYEWRAGTAGAAAATLKILPWEKYPFLGGMGKISISPTICYDGT
jgi:hypothetical protein